MRVAIIGAGLTGLSAAFRLSKKGHEVVVFEKESFPGGLAAGFKKEKWHWHLENFYHHVFTSDDVFKNLLKELNLDDKLFFTAPKTSIFYQNQIARFDTPLSLLSFPYLSFFEKIRTGLIIVFFKLYPSWRLLEKTTAAKFLPKLFGQKTYRILWAPLLKAKFGEKAEEISLAWFWARIKKRSQRLGYLQGGFQLLIDRLIEEIEKNHGRIILNQEITCLNDLNHFKKFDRIIFTLSTQNFIKINQPEMLGCLNLIFELKEKFLVDDTYWLNINEADFPFVAVVEHTNFVDKKNYDNKHLLYVGGYYPQNHPYFKMTKEEIFKKFLPYLKKIKPSFDPQSSIASYQLSKSLSAQPVIPINYSQIKPAFATPLPNVYLANIQQIYPWDRGMNYSIELGEKIVDHIFRK